MRWKPIETYVRGASEGRPPPSVLVGWSDPDAPTQIFRYGVGWLWSNGTWGGPDVVSLGHPPTHWAVVVSDIGGPE